MKKFHVVIIGSGFGGVFAAKHLKPFIESDLIEITIINRTNYFLFTPLLHEVATGGLTPTSVIEPVRQIFRHENVEFVEDEVTTIDPIKKEVGTKTHIFAYDYLIVSSGAETNYYGTPGADKNAFTLKNLDDALAIRRQLIASCEKGALTEDRTERQKLLSCIVVGAGATGVELAAEIIEFMKETLCSYYRSSGISKDDMSVHLVAASPDLLSQFPQNLRVIAQKELENDGVKVMTSMKVTGVEPGKIIFSDGKTLEGNTIVWVAGVKPSYIEIPGAPKEEKSGRIKINEFLQVSGVEHIFALGDASGTLPMLAQVAVQQGKTVAKNIMADIEGQTLTPFVFREKGLLVSLGQWYATGTIFGVTLKGPLMWFIWRTIYLFNFHSWRKRVKIASEWTINLFYPRDISQF